MAITNDATEMSKKTIGLVSLEEITNTEKTDTPPRVKPLKNSNSKSSLISDTCLELLQIRHQEEEKSARLYEDMYMYLNNLGLVNLAAVWHKYAHEELDHADWAREYLMSLGLQPKLCEMPCLPGAYDGFKGVVEESFKHEVEITQQCNALAAEAVKCEDHMLYALASKYLKEQIEEVDKMQTWMDQIKLFGTDGAALLYFEQQAKSL
jgi:ferritin